MRVDIPLPVLLDGSMAEVRRIQPKRQSVSLSLAPLSTASLELTKQQYVPERSWVRLYTVSGEAGIFRTHTPNTNCVTGDMSVQLDHGICEIGDYVITTDLKMDNTADVVFPQIFNHYRGSLWQLGTIEATGKIKAESDHGNVLQTLVEALAACPGYMFQVDQSSVPWTLSVVARPATVTGEGRLSRNVRGAQLTLDDTELCTRVYADKLTGGYLDADTQGIYGLIEQRIDGDDDMTADEVLAIAQEYLNRRKSPVRAISLNLMDLSTITAEPLDQIRCGQLYRLALDDGQTYEETVVTIDYPDVYGKPLEANVMLAEEADSMASVAAGLQLQLTKVTQQYTKLYKHITEDEESLTLLARNVDIIGGEQQGQRIELDDVKIRLSSQEVTTTNMNQTLQAAKIDVAAQTGITMTALKSTTDLLGTTVDEHSATLQIQDEAIRQKVTKGNVATQLSVELGNVSISGGNLYVSGMVTTSELETAMARIDTQISEGIVTEYLVADAISSTGSISASAFRVGARDLGTCIASFGDASSSGGVVTIPYTRFSGGTDSITFNMADTAYVQDAVAAAYQRGLDEGSATVTVDALTVTRSGKPTWSNGVLIQKVHAEALHEGGGGDTDVLKAVNVDINVDATDAYNAGSSSVAVSSITNTSSTVSPSGKVLTAIMQATASNGATKSQTFNINIEKAYNTGRDAVTLSNSSVTTTATIYNDSSGTVDVKLYIKLSNGNSYTPWVSVPYKTID